MRRPAPLPAPAGADGTGSGGPARPDSDAATAPDPDDATRRAHSPASPEPTGQVPADGPGPVHSSDGGPDAREVRRAARARRRVLRAEVRRFTGARRRRRWIIGAAAAALVAVAALSAATAYSPLFAVERISVVGADRLDPVAVEQALASQRGTPLAAIDESAIKAALVPFPLIESYTVEAQPPHDLIVRIVERTPVGVIPTDGGFDLVDAAGVTLSRSPDPEPGYALLDVAGGAGSDAFRAAGTVMRTLPEDLRGRVSTASATTADDVTLTLADTGTRVIWGSAEDSAMKALALARIMTARPPDGVSVYDVSSPAAIVVR